MELLFLYVKKYDDIFEDQQVNFSSNYSIEYKDGYLNIEKKNNHLKNYYGNNVKSITMFYGKNGVGKSTLLDLLGMRLDDRCINLHIKRESLSYFLMYHLHDDYYGFEFSDSSYMEGDGKITNIDTNTIEKENLLYTPWISWIFLLEGKNLVYEDILLKKWVKEKAETRYAYITEDRYNSRISNDVIDIDEPEIMFSRKYYKSENYHEYLYKYLIYMKNKEGFYNFNKQITVENIIKDEIRLFRDDIDDESKDYLDEKIDELEIMLDNAKDWAVIEENNKKENFLKNFYIELIEYHFFNNLSGWIWNRKPKFRGIDILDEEYQKLIIYIENQGENRGREGYSSILKYVLDKVDTEAEHTIQTNESNAVLYILEVIQELPEKYFRDKRTIVIDCKDPIDRHVLNFLKIYDDIYKQKNTDGTVNTIDKILKIIPPEMSEGQRVFLDIMSKAVLAVNEAEKGNHIVLLIDEPDRAIHPELARNFIDILLRDLNQCEGRTIQVVLTSHSPFIVTDILPENVYAITMQESDGKSIIKQKQDTFATNIYYLLMDTFMLENTFGKYSYDKIKDAVKKLKGEEIDEKELNSIKSFIDRIGEKTVRKKLLELYYAKDRRYLEKQKISQEILHIDDEEKLRKIKRILDE